MDIIKTVLLAATLAFSNVGIAASEADMEAEKLLNALNMQGTMTKSMDVMLEMQVKQNPAIHPFKGVMKNFYNKYMSYESLKPDLIKIYSNTFTASELKEISAFYKTSLGQKMLLKLPSLMEQGGKIGAARVQKNMPELQQMIAAEIERIKKSKQ